MQQTKTDKNLQRAYFKCIEAELFRYQATKQELHDLRMAIIESGGQPELPVYTGPGDTTGKKAVKLVTSVGIYEMERRVKAIEKALKEAERLEPGRMELVRLKYFDKKLTNYGIIKELNISEATFYRWRRELIYSIADKLGWDAGQGL